MAVTSLSVAGVPGRATGGFVAVVVAAVKRLPHNLVYAMSQMMNK